MTTPSRTTFVTLVKLEVFRMKTAVIILGLLIISVSTKQQVNFFMILQNVLPSRAVVYILLHDFMAGL